VISCKKSSYCAANARSCHSSLMRIHCLFSLSLPKGLPFRIAIAWNADVVSGSFFKGRGKPQGGYQGIVHSISKRINDHEVLPFAGAVIPGQFEQT
jgi:hypothetical protein